MRVSKAALMAFALLFVGAACGAAALRAWQQSKLYLTKPRMTLRDARYEMLKHATRRPAIVMFGDSITAGVPWSEVAECSSVANYGFHGDTSAQVLDRVREVLLSPPKAVFLMVGANDVINQTSSQETANTVRSIVTQLEAAGITVFFHPILPIDGLPERVAETNKEVAKRLAETKATIVPLPIDLADTRDGLHLGPSGFVKWHDAIKGLMRQQC
jgi:lysophospholipase L1-like esterase